MRSRLRYLTVLLVVGLMASACPGDNDNNASSGNNQAAAGQYPRNETLYTMGTAWEPPKNWNPIIPNHAMGTVGLVYEPLFIFNPEKLQIEPWLAEKGEWSADKKQYTLTLRDGVQWADGKPFTADDVKYTVELGKIPAVPYSTLWTWLASVDVVDQRTVRFTFSDPRVQEWENWLYENAIVPKHIWESRSETDITTTANENPIGTGPYEFEAAAQDRMVWKKKDNWWATKALNLEVKPKYIVDIVNSSNEVAMGLMLQGKLDISNNFLPGIANLVKGNFNVKTYYSEPPYMLSYNTATLIPNTTKAPMNDAAFRKALATSIDTKKIVESVYQNIVSAASPTGLLPNWDPFIDKAAVSQYGFTFNTDQAKKILADAGYRDRNGDGKVETPSGGKISLKLIVPSGWTDWMEAARVIASSAQAAGIDIQPEFPAADALDDARTAGNFDLVINNWSGLSNTPWTYYAYVYQLPVQKEQFSRNFARYSDQETWNLVQNLSRTAQDDPAFTTILSDIQKRFMTDLPVIPLWYNGLWAQYSDAVWTNWPSSAPGAPKALPATWNDLWEMGSIKMLTELKPVSSDSK